MICVSIAESDFERCIQSLKRCSLAEVRLERTDFSDEQLRLIFSLPMSLVATFRSGDGLVRRARDTLVSAITYGADYVDIELESTRESCDEIMSAARSCGCKVIVSHHDLHGTPDRETLVATVERCLSAGADIAKIACLVNSEADCARILSLYDSREGSAGKIIALGMGEKGRLTRVGAPLLGAPFTYACLSRGTETAEGQLSVDELRGVIHAISHG